MASSEISTMRKFEQVFEANKASLLSLEMNYIPIPIVHDYGMINLQNFDTS